MQVCAVSLYNQVLIWSAVSDGNTRHNPSKSNAIFFSPKELSNLPPLTFGNETIIYCKSVKSLELILSQTLSWDDHINKICMEISIRLSMLWQTQLFTPKATRKLLFQVSLLQNHTYGLLRVSVETNQTNAFATFSTYESTIQFLNIKTL